MTSLHQQRSGCSDFDVRLGDQNSPSFRVLLPEWIHGQGYTHKGLLHIIPGAWREEGQEMHGRFTAAHQLDIGVRIEPRETEIRVRLTVENIGNAEILDAWANVCASVNHLPGKPDWSNESFISGVPLDRGAQGRYWFEVVTPKRLLALTAGGWVPMHPCPDRPDATSVPLYSFAPSPASDACACAVESPGGGMWFYQAWDAPCRWCTPCPGNACMHLEPFLSERLSPGEKTSVGGRVGIHRGDRTSWETLCRSFRSV